MKNKKEEGRRKKEKKEKSGCGNYLCKETIVWNTCLETLVLEILV